MAFGPYFLTATELAVALAADRLACPHLLLRDAGGALRLVDLDGAAMTVGRDPDCDIALTWDPAVSRAHVRLERSGARWTATDDGLSRNGTRVNGQRIAGRRTLEDGDVILVGATALVVRGAIGSGVATVHADDVAAAIALTAAERRVLAALCRPWVAAGGGPAAPAGNREIADELVLSVAGVKTHLRSLFAKFGVGELPQNAKRAELARRAVASGAATASELRAAQE